MHDLISNNQKIQTVNQMFMPEQKIDNLNLKNVILRDNIDVNITIGE